MSMSFLLSVLTLTTVLVLSVLLLFVLGKLVWLEKATNALLSGKASPPGTGPSGDADPYFYGLNDEALWRALSGEYESSLSELELDEIRPRYAISLSKAIIRLVKEANTTIGGSLSTRNSIDIFTTRGRVCIWLPPERASELIELGTQLKSSPPTISQETAKSKFSELLADLYGEVGLECDNEVFNDIYEALFPEILAGSANSSALGASAPTESSDNPA